MSDEMFELLEKAYEEGLKGRVDSFDLWLSNLGIDSKLFSQRAIFRLLQDNVGATVDREAELSAIVEFIGFYERESNLTDRLFHLPVIGINGVGKTQLLKVLMAFLGKKENRLPPKFIDASEFSGVQDDQEEEQAYLALLDELKSKQYEVLLVDGCDHDKNIVEALRGLSKHFKKGILVTAWTPYHWDFFRDNVEEFLPATKEIRIGPFSSQQTLQFLSTVFRLVSLNRFTMKEELSQVIHNFSGGVPSNILSLMLRSFQESFHKKKSLDEESIKTAARFLALDGASERITQLADHQLLILKHILLESDPRGTRPTQLVEILGKDKATVSYHLGELSKLRLLESDRIGRWVFYRVRREVAALVGLRLEQEADFLA